jgi:hypothetical protein
MENRHGLVVDVQLNAPTGTGERDTALELLDWQWECRGHPVSVGADKEYHTREFVDELWMRTIQAHIARIEGRSTPGLDGRTTRSLGYRIRKWIRKWIVEIFGWMKTVGHLRRTRYRGEAKVATHTLLTAIAYDLLWMAKLCPRPAEA